MSAALSYNVIQLSDSLRCATSPGLSPAAFMQRFGITAECLAELAKVHPAVLRTNECERAQDYMRNALSVVGLMLDFNGGDLDRAIFWYRSTPLTELGGDTAEQYVAAGHVEGVRRYVRNLAAGATG